MKAVKRILLLILVVFELSSCLITDNVSSLKVEILRPGIFNMPDSVNRVAIFINRDIRKPDTCVFKFSKGMNIFSDSILNYKSVSSRCTDALTSYLKDEAYFGNVSNYSDSLRFISEKKRIYNDPDYLLKETNSDVGIFLTYFLFENAFLNTDNNSFYTQAALSWVLVFENDTVYYTYKHNDTLVFNAPDAPDYKPGKLNVGKTILDAANYLGNSFGSKIIPSWIEVERMYYKSSDPEMRRAIKYAQNNDWLHAAEIWNKETKNKKRLIAAKATYNMALACEMEGKPDAGIDWLVKSYSVLNANNEDHKANCKRYINILATRKKEIKLLERQVRPIPNPENSPVLQ
ncbi:MAG: DUF6340 family protein [Prolixibacteraceae bacterium]|jgi:hypothetical protein